ncbi:MULTISPECIES: ATP-binding protein [Streptomyces]|uniref:ATP-binding protein n=1 Tax=Streptomyces lonegramiae TaxID=3075524 RepID=A0ABU2XIU9_9ACTN|nr:ATP-binding protein [Streptomyces sp. DSM 41529]MDT0545853.1 ATP-binding protein [Streptomyces sp. DSM 41529]
MDQYVASLEAISTALGGTSPDGLSLLTLPGRDLASAGVARRHVRGTAHVWGLLVEVTEALEAVVGELAANALEHTKSSTITVTLALAGQSTVIAVTDEGVDGTAAGCCPGQDSEHGRGLLIVAAVAEHWGQCRTPQGLTVWAKVGGTRPLAHATAGTDRGGVSQAALPVTS